MSFLSRSGPSPEEVARENYIKKNITATLSLALKTLQQKHVNSEEPIYSEDTANTVCNILEAVFLHGLKSSFSHKISNYLLGVDASKAPQPCFWQLLTRVSHKDVLSQLNHLGQITSEIGMCRAWIRIALNDGVLENYLDAMLADTATLKYFFRRTAYLRDEEQAHILKSYIQGLSNFKFQLSYNSSVLNIWTTTPLVLAGLVEQNTTPRAVMSTSHSENAISQIGDRRSDGLEPIVATGRRTHPRSTSRMSASRSYSEHLTPSPNSLTYSSFDNSMLTRNDIEEIRKYSEKTKSNGSASTPTSQISFPDYMVSPEGAEGSPSRTSTLLSRSPTSSKGKRGGSVEGTVLDAAILEEQDEEGPMEDSDKERNPSSNKQTDTGISQIDATDNSNLQDNNNRSEDGAAGTSSQPSTSSQTPRPSTIALSRRCVPLSIGKTPPLQPVLSDTTAQVEMAKEVSPSMIPSSESEENVGLENMDEDEEGEANFYSKYTPSPKSNALGTMDGWSSEFHEPDPEPCEVPEETPADICMQIEQQMTTSTQVESYTELIRDYPAELVEVPSVREVLEQLPHSSSSPDHHSPNHKKSQQSSSPEDALDYPEDYEVLPINLNINSVQASARTQELVALVGTICNEKGLDQQNYQCSACSRPVGMIYGKARVCTYDGCYYCYECHENEEAVIPSRIVHNWDFNKHKVACHTAQFLKQAEEEPLLNIQHINPRLYDHVSDIKEIRELRTQLRYLKAYLFTCKQSVADELRKQVWPREYLYDDIHVYSLQDLLQIQSGHLAGVLVKVIKFASKHVYDCRLCSQKGFICEICDSPKVIYPFQVEATFRCDVCSAVFHRDCKPNSKPCPKCERQRLRQRSIGHHSEVDYAYGPES